ncbi:ABC-2 type transport system permease protein [Halobacillus karajensis]|uniref:Transport permease protein n=1 Tax=Halobacillus karajensis TaxID=195088 RepID=A0A024P870_9BACI|nr:ABC transporter permease [Halobacillus karajensis]CDQ20291.1 inner membrane transport permease [Halobacillus karajensis]CDQ25048.1 inner membrane transport permease [Halobacillus karajensis]CDQ28591.1 inner membrane transport permease [Halobacillus karajensis]SEI11867.1 ABC-2 type transport system permease protein [Halobacillus karajensis]
MSTVMKLAHLETKMFFRDRLSVFWTFLFPVAMIWLFGSMFSGSITGPFSFAELFIPSWIGVNIVTTSFFTLGTVLAGYRETGVLRRYQSTPLQPWKILAAHTVQGTVIFFISAVLLMVFGMMMYDLELPLYIGSTLLALVISILAFFPFALFVTSLAKNTQAAAAISSLFLNLMLFLSGATFPLELMPTVLQYVSKVLPLYYVIQLLRGTWNEAPITEYGFEVGILIGISAVSIFLASRFFRWDDR